MMELQELITRGRLIFSRAPKRLEVFQLIDGKRNAKDIAIKTGRKLSAILNDIKKLKDLELIRPKRDNQGNIVKKNGSIIYEKVPLLKHVPLSYFRNVTKKPRSLVQRRIPKRSSVKKTSPIRVPSAKEILDICESGESQIYEFKSPGVDVAKITKEIAAFLNTKNGGLIFYGIDDDGTIIGSDKRRQDFDQMVQNSVRNTISPSPNIEIKERDVLGHKILIIVVPPWDRENIYMYRKDGRFYIRKGTNVFVVTPEELKKLARGEYVV